MKKILTIWAVVAFGISLTTGCEKVFDPVAGNGPEENFELIWETFREEYAVFEDRGIDWDSVYMTYRWRVDKTTTMDELYGILCEMLSELNDGHVTLTAPGKQVCFSNRFRRDRDRDGEFDLEVIRQNYLVTDMDLTDSTCLTGRIDGEDIAYIHFDHIRENFLRFGPFLGKYPGVSGLIIDLRHNRGGDYTYFLEELGQLTDIPRVIFYSRTKNGKGENDFTGWKEWKLLPASKQVATSMVIITDRMTISAGERAVMAFRSLPQTTVIGDTTNGAIGTVIGRELANGWYFSLVAQQVRMFDGVSYEGAGLPPDLVVRNDPSDIQQGIDRVLETAIQLLK